MKKLCIALAIVILCSACSGGWQTQSREEAALKDRPGASHRVLHDPRSGVRMIDLDRSSMEIHLPTGEGDVVNKNFILSDNTFNGEKEELLSLQSIETGTGQYLLVLLTDYSLSFYHFAFEPDSLGFSMCTANDFDDFPGAFTQMPSGSSSVQLVYNEAAIGRLDLEEGAQGAVTVTCEGTLYADIVYRDGRIVIY